MKRLFFLLALAASAAIATPVLAEGGGEGYTPITIPTANGGSITVAPATVDGTTITCRVHGYDGNPEKGIVTFDIPFQENIQIPPFPPEIEEMEKGEARKEAEKVWVKNRISPLTRLPQCILSALRAKYRQEYRLNNP
jgi:hypothetical protein